MKTKCIRFSLPNIRHRSRTILVRNKELEFVNATVFLGITLDNRLQWCPHISKLAKSLSSAAYAVKKIRNLADVETARSVYFGCFHSLMSFGILLWGNAADVHIIFVLEKRTWPRYHFPETQRDIEGKEGVTRRPANSTAGGAFQDAFWNSPLPHNAAQQRNHAGSFRPQFRPHGYGMYSFVFVSKDFAVNLNIVPALDSLTSIDSAHHSPFNPQTATGQACEATEHRFSVFTGEHRFTVFGFKAEQITSPQRLTDFNGVTKETESRVVDLVHYSDSRAGKTMRRRPLRRAGLLNDVHTERAIRPLVQRGSGAERGRAAAGARFVTPAFSGNCRAALRRLTAGILLKNRERPTTPHYQ
ncbi:hypothetical protein EVAR_74276_1 [Eumeta japonica]|uniref:Uncharacterized protein n=1 Tax=Eumeta variegata TaxID=151549 RepID=A0A4C1SCZ2_EUMVA|nr:hypothetical protein EVAR_74276_1 [Eumeta japonica]